MKWNKVEDILPKNGQVVFIRHKNCNIINMDGSLDHYDCVTFHQGEHKPNGPWSFCDSGFGNNELPYAWQNGAMQYFGQDVSHWMAIPLIGDDKDGA